MNSHIAVNIPIHPVYDNTSLLPLYRVQTQKYTTTTQNICESKNENKIYVKTSHGENNC